MAEFGSPRGPEAIYPTSPPTMEAAQPFGPMPVAGEAGMAAAAAVAPQRLGYWSSGKRRAAGAVLAVFAAPAAIAGAVAFNPFEHNSRPAAVAAPAAPNGQTGIAPGDVCKDGMFPSTDTAFENTTKAHDPANHPKVENEVNLEASKPLNLLDDNKQPSTKELDSFLFGTSTTETAGNVCHSADSLATLSAAYTYFLGTDGNANQLKVKELNPDKAVEAYVKSTSDALLDAKILAAMVDEATPNANVINGPVWRVIAEPTNGGQFPFQLKVVNDPTNFAIGEVDVLDPTRAFADTPLAHSDTLLLFDKTTQQWYLTNPAGFPVESQQGGGQFGTDNGSGESNNPGDTPESGGNGGFTPGTAPSFGPGATTPETAPPATAPPTTSPPTTAPPTTSPPTTAPPTTPPPTTAPPTTKPGDPGQPGA